MVEKRDIKVMINIALYSIVDICHLIIENQITKFILVLGTMAYLNNNISSMLLMLYVGYLIAEYEPIKRLHKE